MKKINRVGERYVTKQGYEILIVEYTNNANLVIEFQDKHKYRRTVSMNRVVDGSIINPYHPSVRGSGYLGVLSDGNIPKARCREYEVWYNMITRIFDESYHDKYPTYKSINYSEELLCYAYFLEYVLPNIPNYQYWLEHPNERVSLDKDILGEINGKKGYYVENLIFVTNEDNVKERNIRTPQKRIKVKGTNIITGEVVEFESINEASRKLGLHKSNISGCIKGRAKSCGGYKWEIGEE